MRIVLDTNVLIDGFQDDLSAPARLIEAAIDGELTALSTTSIEKEYRLILARLIENEAYRDRIDDFLGMTEKVTPSRVEVVIDDPEDYKFLQAAVGGEADVLVTNDHHLLDVGNLNGISIMTPAEAWNRFESEDGNSNEWQNFVRGLGIGGQQKE